MKISPLNTERPLVSILIVSHNNSLDILGLWPTLELQTYKNIEVIIAENGSLESYVSLSRSLYRNRLKATVFHIKNKGFASGVNFLSQKAKGDYIMCLNPDTVLDPHCVESLLCCLSDNPNSIAACPITYFKHRYIRLSIVDKLLRIAGLDIKRTCESLVYDKCFIRDGLRGRDFIGLNPVTRSVTVDLPYSVTEGDLFLHLLSHCNEVPLDDNMSLFINNHRVKDIRRTGPDSLVIKSSDIEPLNSFRMVNNAGSYLLGDTAGDIGYGEVDDGQYSEIRQVDAFCGVCFLIRKIVLIARPIFLEHFFAYYEDSELSYWIKHSIKAEILFTPNAIVYHHHSRSTKENSLLWNLLVKRSSMYFKLATSPSNVKDADILSMGLKNIYQQYRDVPADVLSTLYELDKSFASRHSQSHNIVRVGICNEHINSRGGGEAHCLAIASLISQNRQCEVYFLCPIDIDREVLERYFNIDLSRVIFVAIATLAPWVTAIFDVFINSSYGSLLQSYAKHSYYVVSFPSRQLRTIARTYTFWHNSSYTYAWASRFMGEHRSSLILPTLCLQPKELPEKFNKQRIILNVGRFQLEGHCKNQHLIAESFIKAKDSGLLPVEWTLCLIGSVDDLSIGSVRHFQIVSSIAKNRSDIALIANATKSIIDDFYYSSSVYIHATGLGKDCHKQPEMHEHYGITVLESMLHGCQPLLYNVGGPFETARDIMGFDPDSFSTSEEMVMRIIKKGKECEKLIAQRNLVPFRNTAIMANKYLIEAKRSATQIIDSSLELAEHPQAERKI